MKESKSATKVPVYSGDLARTARHQKVDTEGQIALPPGVTLNQFDSSMDLALFRDTADHVLERALANHGIPPAILHHAGATSGYEIELRHVGIRQRRREMEPVFRRVERELAEVESRVLAADGHPLAFSTDDWSVNFGDTEMPRHPKEALEIFEHARRLGLTDTIEEEMARDPDCTVAEAWSRVERRVQNETKRNALMRPLQQISGSLRAETPTETSDADTAPEREQPQ
jgi:hypothetical protein